MIQNKDQFTGEREPQNRLRHGQGIYTYSNKYFQYEGQWENGKKHGHGILRMNAPNGLGNNSSESQYNNNINQYEGEFFEGEITGKGVYKYANSSIYEGDFLNGEKHGEGEFASEYIEYKGQWKENQYHGKGKLVDRIKGIEVSGEFKRHKMDGNCSVQYENGEAYEGQMQGGFKHGEGEFNSKQYNYVGEWKKDLKDGKGKFSYSSGFIYEGDWEADQPVLTANRLKIQEIKKPCSAESQGEEKQQQQQQDEQNQVVEYEILGKPFNLEIQSMFQPAPVLDPVQPSEEEIEELIKNWQKENKKNKNPPPMPDFREPRMIDPELIPVTQESQRKLKLSLIFELDPEKGKENEPRETKTFKLDWRQDIERRRQEIEELKKQRQLEAELEAEQQKEEQNKKGKKPPAKDNKKGKNASAEDENELKVLIFKEEEPEENKPLYVLNNDGSILLENFEFPEDFPVTQGGNYYINVENVSKELFGEVESTKISLVINPPGGADPKKKKK